MYERTTSAAGARGGVRARCGRVARGCILRGEDAQATLEYALVASACLAIAVGLAALWHAGADGVLARLAERAASHALSMWGAVDIALY